MRYYQPNYFIHYIQWRGGSSHYPVATSPSPAIWSRTCYTRWHKLQGLGLHVSGGKQHQECCTGCSGLRFSEAGYVQRPEWLNVLSAKPFGQSESQVDCSSSWTTKPSLLEVEVKMPTQPALMEFKWLKKPLAILGRHQILFGEDKYR